MTAAVLAAVTLLAGCQSGTTPLTVSGLTEIADDMPEDGASSCPLPYDMAAAAESAGLDREAGSGPAREDGDTPIATSEGGKRAQPGDPLAEHPGALVSCTFHIGRRDIQVHTIATRKPNAITPLAPAAAALTRLSGSETIDYINGAAKAETGDVLVASSGNVATVRLKLKGEGDAALLVGFEDSSMGAPSPKQVEELTVALTDQVQ
ncbi:hypothetical protein ACFY4H_34250 [Streptomyces althioticus]|uniref:hypothetical protein n=1 Tax=Streptomyces althioticus TaxID=83380 RepID=UPI00367AD8BA